jgi:hypothetical protein
VVSEPVISRQNWDVPGAPVGVIANEGDRL